MGLGKHQVPGPRRSEQRCRSQLHPTEVAALFGDPGFEGANDHKRGIANHKINERILEMTSQFFTQDALEVIIFPVVFPFIPSPMNIPRFRWFGEVFLIVPRTRSPGDLLYDFHPQGRSRVQQANGTHPSKGTQETPGHKSRIQVIQVIRVARNIPTVHDSDSLHLT